MNKSFDTIRDFLTKGDPNSALDAFAEMRPIDKSSLDGLNLCARIHLAGGRWEKVDVVCRILRKDYPAESSGYRLGAESLYRQGRTLEAIGMLKERHAGASDGDISNAIQRFEGDMTASVGAQIDDAGTPSDR